MPAAASHCHAQDGRYHEEGGFKTDEEAAKVAAQLELDASRGDWVSSGVAGRTSFAEYVSTLYWPTTQHLEVSTRATYGYYLDKHFLPRFGKIPMRRISPAMIQCPAIRSAPDQADHARRLALICFNLRLSWGLWAVMTRAACARARASGQRKASAAASSRA